MSLQIATYNVNSIANPTKRKAVFDFLYTVHADIFLLQETHSKLFHTNEVDQAIELREKLALSAKIEEVARYGEIEIRVTICRVPPHFKKDEIAEELKSYGEPFKVNTLTDMVYK